MPATAALTDAQRAALFEDGYTLLPAAVPAARVGAALRAINASLGAAGMHPEQLPVLRARSYCPELQGDPVITGLYGDTPLRALAESAIGAGRVRPVRGGQIALRFPSSEPPRPPRAHLDGMYTPTNGVPAGTIANFTALVGVFLSDVPEPFAGNFSVWPGSHRVYERHFRERGPQSLLDGMPAVDIGQPRQITARAGDAVLCHYQLAHGVAGHGAPHVRYAVFFRLAHVDHEQHHWDCMTDIWLEWEGMRDLVGGGRRPG